MILLQQNRFDLLLSDLDLDGMIGGLDLIQSNQHVPRYAVPGL